MGANESKLSDEKSIVNRVNQTLRHILLIFHFIFIVICFVFDCWRPLTEHSKGLQSELEATNKEGECVRQKLKFQDAQLERVKEEQYVVSEEDGRKYCKFCFVLNLI